MIDGLSSSDETWAKAFFASPNELHWQPMGNQAAMESISEHARPWLQLLTSPDSKAPIVLPYVKGGEISGWYATTRTVEGGHELAAELKAWLGNTYLTLFEEVPIQSSDPSAAAMRRRSRGVVWRFSGGSRDANSAIAKRLGEYISLLSRRPDIKRRAARPVGAIRGDFERALLARDASAAESFIAELRSTGRLNEENLRYLDVRLNAGLGLWPQMARNHSLIQTMSDLALPPQILADIVEALYRTHVEAVEALGDAGATLAAFEEHVGRRYPRLFASRKGVRTPRVVKAFLLFEQSQARPSAQIVDELSALLEPDDHPRLLMPVRASLPSPDPRVAATIVDTTSEAALEAEDAFDDHQYDRAFVFYLALPLSKKTISRLMQCADFIATSGVRDRLVAKLGEGNSLLTESLPAAVQAKIAALRTATPRPQEVTTSSPNGVAAVPHEVATLSIPLADGWMAWAQQLSGGFDLAGAEQAVQRAVTNWDTRGFRTTSVSSLPFAEMVGNLSGDAAALARRSVPQIFKAFFPLDVPATQGSKPIASLLFTMIAIGDTLSAPDLEIISQLVDILIGLGLSNEEYLTLVADLEDVQDRVRSYAHLPWSLDVSETLAVSPVPSDAGRAARLRFFVLLLGQAQAFAHRLGPQDLLPMGLLAKDYGVETAAIDVLRRPEGAALADDGIIDLGGKLIGIYTLAETAGLRAKVSLEQMFPGCKVEVNSDTVATDRLRNLARSANIFVFAWRSSSHAAFYCIKEEIPGGEPVWAAGKGTASIMRAVLDCVR